MKVPILETIILPDFIDDEVWHGIYKITIPRTMDEVRDFLDFRLDMFEPTVMDDIPNSEVLLS